MTSGGIGKNEDSYKHKLFNKACPQYEGFFVVARLFRTEGRSV
jgi:hypothetical protein